MVLPTVYAIFRTWLDKVELESIIYREIKIEEVG